MAIYAKIKGTKQGALTGGVAAAGFTGQIQVNTAEFGVGNQADTSTGMSVGRRIARPLQITKPLDRSSPLLHTACVTNETMTVDLAYVIEGQGHKPYVTISLTNAIIRDYTHEASFDGGGIERLSFTYTKIEFTWVNGGIVSTDDWTSAA